MKDPICLMPSPGISAPPSLIGSSSSSDRLRRIVIPGVFLAFLVIASVAHAECHCPSLTPKEQTDAATYIFNADIWDVATNPVTKKKVITLDVDDTFKGKPSERLEVQDNEEGTDCAIDFHEGDTYLVYVRWQWGSYLTSRCWGTKLIQQAGTDVQNLGPSDAMKEKYYEKLRIACMGRIDTPCCLSSLRAMRAGGYLPQPDQGCPDDMIPDGVRCEGGYVWCIPTTDTSRHNQKPK